MSSKEDWATPQFRESCTRVIASVAGESESGVCINPEVLEREIFVRSKTREEYMKYAVRLQNSIKTKFASLAAPVKVEKEDVDSKESLLALKTEVESLDEYSSSIKPELTPKTEVNHISRIKTCRTLLQNVLLEDPKRNFSVEFIANCQKWVEVLSMPDNNVPLDVLEKCEAVLMEKFGELDEIDLKILEINCQKGSQNVTPSSSSISNSPNASNESNDPVKALEKLTINQAPWHQNKTAAQTSNFADGQFLIANQQNEQNFEQPSSPSNQVPTNQNQIISTAGTFQPQLFNQFAQNAEQTGNSNTNQTRPIVFTAKPANLLYEKIIPPVTPSGNVLYRTLSSSSSNLTAQNIPALIPNNQRDQERPKSADGFPGRRQQHEFAVPQTEMSLSNQSVSVSSLNNLSQLSNMTSNLQQQQRSQMMNSNFRPESSHYMNRQIRPQSQPQVESSQYSQQHVRPHVQSQSQVFPDNNQQVSRPFLNTGTATQGRFLNVVNIAQMRASDQQPQVAHQSSAKSPNQSSMTHQQLPMQRSNSLQMQPPSTSHQHQMQRSMSNPMQIHNRQQVQGHQNQPQILNTQHRMPMQNNFSSGSSASPNRAQILNSQPDVLHNWRTDNKNSLLRITADIEEHAFTKFSTKEQYMNYLFSIFEYARNKLDDDNNNNRSSNIPRTPKGTKFDELKDLLTNEPQHIKESVMKDWQQLDDQVNQLVRSLCDDGGLDQGFEKMSLTPDEFENQTNEFLKKLKQTEPNQEPMET